MSCMFTPQSTAMVQNKQQFSLKNLSELLHQHNQAKWKKDALRKHSENQF